MKLNNKRGISLIVLVITIIVMIILATAIILSLSSNGIIGKANEATNSTDMANLKESATIIASEYDLAIKTGTTIEQTAEQYVKEKLAVQDFTQEQLDMLKVTDKGKVIIGSGPYAENKGVKLGEYVDYIITEPITSTTYKVYDSTTNSESTSEYFTTQTGDNALKWRYMGMDDNGNALLVADRPLDSTIHLYGVEGYLQAVDKLNGVCEELYSTDKGIARSINLDDVNRVLGVENLEKYFVNSEGTWVYIPYAMKVRDIMEKYNQPEIKSRNITTPDGSDIYEYINNACNFDGRDYKEITTTEYKLIFQDASGKKIYYKLANRSTSVTFSSSFSGCSFGTISVSSNGYQVMHDGLHHSSPDVQVGNGLDKVRPVIVLNSDVKVGTKTNNVWSLQ